MKIVKTCQESGARESTRFQLGAVYRRIPQSQRNGRGGAVYLCGAYPNRLSESFLINLKTGIMTGVSQSSSGLYSRSHFVELPNAELVTNEE